jgi:membrane protein DedA with SNARE-associated domain
VTTIFRKFFTFVVLGELTWVLLYGGLGYAFGSQWELISDFISNFSGFALGAVVLGMGIYLLVKFGKKPSAQNISGVSEKAKAG